MSTSTSTFGVAACNRHSSRKAIPQTFFSGAAIACIVLGCGWTVYSNVFGASVYPTISNADYDLPVVKRASAPPPVNFSQIFERVAPRVSAPAMVASDPALTFADRFAGNSSQGVAPTHIAETPPQAAAPKLAEAPKPKAPPVQVALSAPVPPPHPIESRTKAAVASVKDMTQRAKAAVMSIASNEKQTIVEKLWGKPQPQSSHASLLSFASADASITGSLGNGASQNVATLGTTPRYERDTAVYDISAHTVYLPDGSKLEAHSGRGSGLDDPRRANVRMSGPTPPHLYDLTPRESLFHGVAALRLNPVGGEEAIYGRNGLLAHTFMLGPDGASNGCVSFRDYNAFLNAYRNQGIKRLAVVAQVE
jgi:hypothetical protein